MPHVYYLNFSDSDYSSSDSENDNYDLQPVI